MQDSTNLYKLVQATNRSRPIGEIARPAVGWLRTIRDTLGLTLTELGRRLKVTPPAVRSFEQAEAEDRITLASLRRAAAAMGCELVYVLVPRTGTLASLAGSEAYEPGGERHAHTSRPESQEADAAAEKVIDRTWRSLRDES
jgi:predicted DNA-binding mobile mystery protein A